MTIRKTIEAWEEWDEWDYHYMLGRYGFWKAAKLHFGIVLFSFF
jgi:fructoselysine-6-P-deglycase FrlB-like protein